MTADKHREFRPAWWVPGRHAQTIWGRFFRRVKPVATEIVHMDTPDGDFLELVRLAAPTDRPRILLLHGLEGSNKSHYARGLLAACERRGWGMDILIFRSCGSRPNRARRSYHSGETSDPALVLQRVAREFPDAPIGLAGVSLGGNVLLKLLGERGEDLPPNVHRAIAVSVPFDLARGVRYIDQGFSRVYDRHFVRSLRRKAAAKLAYHGDLYDPERLRRARTLYDFDDCVTAPVHGFRDADDYYARSSSIHFLPGIRLPTLLLSAADDPFLPAEVLEEARRIAAANPALTVQFTPRGGHVGFISGKVPGRGEYWMEQRVLEWLDPTL